MKVKSDCYIGSLKLDDGEEDCGKGDVRKRFFVAGLRRQVNGVGRL